MSVELLREKEEEMFLCAKRLFEDDADLVGTLRRLDGGFNLFGRGATQKNQVLEILWQALSDKDYLEVSLDAFDDNGSFSSLYRFFQESTVLPISALPRREPQIYADILTEVCLQLDAIAEHYEEVEGERISESGVRTLRAMHNLLLAPIWVAPGLARAPICLYAEKLLSAPDTDIEKNPITALVGSLNRRDKMALLSVCDNTALYRILFKMDDSGLPSTSLFMRSGYPLEFKRQHVFKHPELQTQDAFWTDMLSYLSQNPGPVPLPALDTWYRTAKESYPRLMENFSMGGFADVLAVIQSYKLADFPVEGRIVAEATAKLLPRDGFAYLANRYVKDIWRSPAVSDERKGRLREFLTTAALYSALLLKDQSGKDWKSLLSQSEPLLPFIEKCYHRHKEVFGEAGSHHNAAFWLGIAVWDMLPSSPLGVMASARNEPFQSPLNDVFAGACHSQIQPAMLLPPLISYFEQLSSAQDVRQGVPSRGIRRKPAQPAAIEAASVVMETEYEDGLGF